MSDLQKYVHARKQKDKQFALNYDQGYEEFKLGLMIKQMREEAGLTQEQLANRLHSKKSVISRMENHADDIKLSTLLLIAAALGQRMRIEFEDLK